MSAELSLQRVSNPSALDRRQQIELAILYAGIFAGGPWREFTRCSNHPGFFGPETQVGDPCPESSCEGVLGRAYPVRETARYVEAELNRPGAALWLLRNGGEQGQLVGFSWAFSYPSPEAFAEDKYATPEMQTAVSGLLRAIGVGADGLYYLSESGILDDPRYRGQGISKEFHRARLEVAGNLGVVAVQRTSSEGPMYRTSSRYMGQIMGPVMEVDAATGLLRPTGEIRNGVTDTENPARVLFASVT